MTITNPRTHTQRKARLVVIPTQRPAPTQETRPPWHTVVLPDTPTDAAITFLTVRDGDDGRSRAERVLAAHPYFGADCRCWQCRFHIDRCTACHVAVLAVRAIATATP